MTDFLYHALGICGEHWHPNLINVLREAKNKENLGEYLTLLTWLDETPVRYGGVPIRNIPDEAF